MAELEMINHMKKSIKALVDKDKKFFEKVKEFTLEIFIIVFAVSLSIWFHERSEHHKEQKEVSYFLNELYKDLDYDLKIYEKAKLDCQITARGFQYISRLPFGKLIDNDSLKYYEPYLFLRYTPIPTQGRYESFKNSGKINNIENAIVEGDILDLFEEDIVSLDLKIEHYSTLQEDFIQHLIHHAKRTETGNTLLETYSSDECVNYAKVLSENSKIDSAYGNCIAKINKINTQIATMIGTLK
jgi:hypothetical protein